MTARTADVVVIGAGVIGSSIAYHLARRGLSVRVLDRSPTPGTGSTGRATGGYRAQFATRVNVQLSLLSRAKLLSFADETGGDSGYAPVGYLFCAHDARALDGLLAAQAVQRDAGLDGARAVDVQDIAELNPALATEGLVGGVFCQTDGYIRPLGLLLGYRNAARALGVQFDDNAACIALESEMQQGERRLTAVRTADERIACGTIVNAAGPWAASVSAMAGATLPVVPLRRQVASTVETRVLPADMPMTIMTDDGFHMRVRDGRVLLLWPDTPATPDPFDHAFDPAWLPEVTRRARARVPVLRDVAVDRNACWSGLYEMSPDDHLIFGATPGIGNFMLANGSSGHGVMHSPAVGQLMAELLCDGVAHSVDMHAVRASRFDEGDSLAAPVLL